MIDGLDLLDAHDPAWLHRWYEPTDADRLLVIELTATGGALLLAGAPDASTLLDLLHDAPTDGLDDIGDGQAVLNDSLAAEMLSVPLVVFDRQDAVFLGVDLCRREEAIDRTRALPVGTSHRTLLERLSFEV